MNEDFKKGVLSESGKMLVRGVITLCAAMLVIVGINTKAVIAWFQGLPLTHAQTLWLRIAAVLAVVIILLIFMAVIVRLMKGGEKKQPPQPQPPQPRDFPAPPNLSNTPRRGGKLLGFGPEEIILSPFTFHILKAYNNFTSPHSAMSVDAVSHYCQVTREEALPAVQELHRMKYIFTLTPAPGEWNGEYQITPIGRDYARRHAT
jgi:hypothetical protein